MSVSVDEYVILGRFTIINDPKSNAPFLVQTADDPNCQKLKTMHGNYDYDETTVKACWCCNRYDSTAPACSDLSTTTTARTPSLRESIMLLIDHDQNFQLSSTMWASIEADFKT